MEQLKYGLFKKVAVAILIFLAILGFSFNNIRQADLRSEPADPDTYDISVWKNIEPGIHSGFGSIDVAYSKSIPPGGNPGL
jgi:hypothetical protein